MILRIFVLVLLCSSQPALAAWHKATSQNFIVYGEMESAQLRQFVERVEKFDATLRGITGLGPEPTPNKLTIFVTRNVSVLQRFMGAGSKNVYGFYAPEIAGSYAVVPRSAGSGEYDLDAETVLFHEYAHHFMLQYFAVGYPAWYVEGFAEYYSTTEFNKDGSVSVGMPAKHRFGSIVFDKPFPLTRMFAAETGKMTQDENSSFYSYAWLLTHYLRFEKARSGQLTKYLKAFADGKPPMEAATSAFGDIKVLEVDLQKYIKARRMSYMRLSGVKLPTPNIQIEQLDEANDALMPLYMRFVRGSRGDEDVQSFVTDARAMALKFPNTPRALECLAEGELDAEQLDAATKANDALLALKPTDARGLLRRARIAAARMRDKDDYPGGWKAIRSLIVKANRAAPDDPFPLVEYYTAHAAEGIEPPDLARQGLERALELAPQIMSIRFMLANHYMNKEMPDVARVVLAPLLNEPHSADVRQQARALLERPTRASKKKGG